MSPKQQSVDTAPLVADIERSQQQLATSLELLADKASPKKLIARVKERVALKVEDVKDRISPVRIAKRTLASTRERVGVGPGRSTPALGNGTGKPLELPAASNDGR
jgi:hypothetical protein